MKKAIIIIVMLMAFSAVGYAQGRSISKKPKITTPYITTDGDTLKVGLDVQLLEAAGDNNCYKYVQLLNKFNEPIQPATTRVAFKKQPILFFKEEDGVMYAFTEFFSINIEGALYSKEIRTVPKKN